jgi:hypothetical protein
MSFDSQKFQKPKTRGSVTLQILEKIKTTGLSIKK